jgi:Cof subfamily protein (haloacid dehalogenase superfamily)
MNNKYALFFDIDGTLVSFNTHQIPPSTIFALTQAKANGHKVFISTGRPPIIMNNLGAIEHLIDGYVTINGALCYIGDQTILSRNIPRDVVDFIVEDSLSHNHSLFVVGEKDMAAVDPHGEIATIFGEGLGIKNLNMAKPLNEVLKQRIFQLTPFFNEEYESKLAGRIHNCTFARWHPDFIDITAKGADKGEGILAIARHMGLDRQQTIAFGDGGNDVAMIETAGIGIAMGNAFDVAKNAADYITTSVDDDGILNAMRHFKLI